MPFLITDGLDVSHNNGKVDWAAVASSGFGFAFAKASEGEGFIDPQFASNYPAIAANGMFRGAYHFFRPGKDAAAQATLFLKQVPSLGVGDLPPVLDVEVNDGLAAAAIIDGMNTWLQAVESALGRTPMIYSGPGFWRGSLGNSDAFHRYPFWVAEYGVKQPNMPSGMPTYAIWQWSETEHVPGVNGNADLDRFNGSADQLRTLAGG